MNELKFQLLDKVLIIPLENKEGQIINIWLSNSDIQYKVRYFLYEEPKEIYFYEWELTDKESIKPEKKIGFK